MPVVTAYTEMQLADYLLTLLGSTAAVIGWTSPNDVQTAIDDCLYALGLTDIVDATNMRSLRAVGKRELWRQVADVTAGYHQFSADGASYQLQQIHEQAVARLAAAELECAALGVDSPGYGMFIDTLVYTGTDPYEYQPPVTT